MDPSGFRQQPGGGMECALLNSGIQRLASAAFVIRWSDDGVPMKDRKRFFMGREEPVAA